MSAMPTIATGRPTLPISKNPMGPRPASTMRPETTRLVEVPMTLINPPSTTANDSGMSSLDTDTRWRSAHDCTSGMSMATMGVLLRKAEAPAAGMDRRARGLRTPPSRPRAPCSRGVRAPVFCTPAATT